MNCLHVRARLAAYVSGDLSAGDSAAVETHLEGCALCRSEAAAFERCEQALRALAAVEAAPDLSEDLRRRIAAPIPWRPRWGLAAAVAGAACAAAAVVLLWPSPRKAPAPSAAIARRTAAPPAVVSMPQTTVVTAEIPARPAAPIPSPSVTRSAPRPVPAEVAPEQAAGPAVVSVPIHAPEPAELEKEPAMEAVPIMASFTTQPERAGGVVLLLGQPEPARPASSCYLEVALPNGARSVLERSAKQEAPGTPRVIQISYEQIAPQPQAQDRGG